MTIPGQRFERLLREDRRYRLEAYEFVFEALQYAHNALQMGTEQESEPLSGLYEDEDEDEVQERPHQHVTGQELCQALRMYAQHQFGYMAKCVLNSWGIYTTSDIGEIVYNLIRIEHMRKTQDDRREDFDDVFDFDEAFEQSFEITMPD